MNSTILIVDDDTVTREGLEAILQHSDYQIASASNGLEAIQKAQAISPDLILLDVMMPEMDGFQVCQEIRGIPAIAEVPIIILTALDDQASFMHGLEVGADDFLTKPINRHELRARVRTITRLNRYRSLLTERARIRELTSQIVNLQEEERRHIAQELHDEVGQSLATLNIGLKLLSDEPACQPVNERINDLRGITLTMIDQVRLISSDLRPPALELIGLEPTLAGYCQDFMRRTQIPVLFISKGDIPQLSDAENITLYRFLQESLNNILKHAEASLVWVRLNIIQNTVHLSVRDDGVGLSTPSEGPLKTSLKRKDGTTGMGLLGLAERLTRLSGRLEIASQPGEGVELSAWLPISTREVA